MTTTTLRGVFPDPKPIHRKNFVRENIRHLKEMQGFIQQESKTQSQEKKRNKFKHVAPKVYSQTRKASRDHLPKRPASYHQVSRTSDPTFHNAGQKKHQKIFDKGVQTERPEDIPKLYETGILKYPSPSVVQKPKSCGQGDTGNLIKNMQKLELDEKQNYVKQNIKNIKTKPKQDEHTDPNLPPPSYHKGVLPKYLKDKKETLVKAVDYENENVLGLVLLPDEERKEYLRVARENYAALIKELNSMPMSNDTLKKRKRKMEIEDELKRLDDVIKIFQKPKVFVKADG